MPFAKSIPISSPALSLEKAAAAPLCTGRRCPRSSFVRIRQHVSHESCQAPALAGERACMYFVNGDNDCRQAPAHAALDGSARARYARHVAGDLLDRYDARTLGRKTLTLSHDPLFCNQGGYGTTGI